MDWNCHLYSKRASRVLGARLVSVQLGLVRWWEDFVTPAGFGSISGADRESDASKRAPWLALLLQLRMMGLLTIIP